MSNFDNFKEEVEELWVYQHDDSDESAIKLEKEWNRIKDKYNLYEDIDIDEVQLALGLIEKNIRINGKLYWYTGVITNV